MSEEGTRQGADWPLPKFSFQVDLGDGGKHGFSEVSGLESEAGPIEYRHGDNPLFSAIKVPGLRKTGDVTLKRGVIAKDSAFWAWFDKNRRNVVKRRTVTIALLDEKSTPKMVWTLTHAWPVKVTSSDLNADGNEVAIETLELAYEAVSLKEP